MLMVARVVTAFGHGAFFGIGSVVAANLVPRHKRASAIALMFAGLTLANILGVPAGTALGEIYGWRATFFAVVAIGIAAVIAIVLLVPPAKGEQKGAGILSEIKVLGKLQVWLAMVISALASGSLFAVFTYIKPILTYVSGISTSTVTWVLLLFGAGMTIGNVIGGRLADWKLMPTVIGTLIAVVLTHIVLAATSSVPAAAIVTIFFWGMLTFIIVPPLQMRVVETADEAPNLAATLNQGAFNMGNAAGAWIGGAALTWGVPYHYLPFVGSALAAIGLLVALWSSLLDRKTYQRKSVDDEAQQLSLEPLGGV
jgi:DHA1 family inner membrane transport protein